MITRIAFPTPHSVDIRTYPDMSAAEASTSEIATGMVYIFAELTLATIRAMTLAQMVTVYKAGRMKFVLAKDRVKKLSSKRDAAQRILDIIPQLAKEANEMAAPKKATTAKGKSKTTPKKTNAAGKSGRTSDLLGKKLFKTGEREKGKGHKESRRARSYALIKKGMKYEAALAAGAHKDDIARMLYDNQLEAK